MAMNARNKALLQQLTGNNTGLNNIGGNAMLQSLNQGGGAPAPWAGRKQTMKNLAQQNGLVDPNGGRFRGREILQGLLAKQNAAATSGPSGPLPGGVDVDPIAGGVPIGKGGIDPQTGGIDPVVAPPPVAMNGGNQRPINMIGGPANPGMVGFTDPNNIVSTPVSTSNGVQGAFSPAVQPSGGQGIQAGGHPNGVPAGGLVGGHHDNRAPMAQPQRGALIGQNPMAPKRQGRQF